MTNLDLQKQALNREANALNEQRSSLIPFRTEVLQLCRYSLIGWQDARPGLFGLWSIQVAAFPIVLGCLADEEPATRPST